jgi:biotin transporter BioY
MAMSAGLLVIYACGVGWLGLVARGPDGSPVGLRAALVAGIYPFVIADLVKLLAAAGIVPMFWRLFGRSDPQ